MNDYNRKADIILPVLVFCVLLGIGLWMKISYGGWWLEDISTDYLPNKTVYNLLWLLFIIIFPFAYLFALASSVSTKHRILIHAIFMGIAFFWILWALYLYMKKNVKTSNIFLYITGLLTIIGIVTLWIHRSSVAGILVLFLLWFTMNWYMINYALESNIMKMFDQIKDSFEKE
jgi:hypothetical protein